MNFDYEISINRKSGFVNLDNGFIEIFDNNFQPFYQRENTECFNLPKGTYYTNNNLLIVVPRVFIIEGLPPRERFRKRKRLAFVPA